MSKINNYQELMAERRRLEFKITEQKKVLSNELDGLREKLSPFLKLATVLHFFDKKNTTQSVLSAVVSSGIDLLVGPQVTPKLAWLGKLILSFISKRFLDSTIKNQSI